MCGCWRKIRSILANQTVAKWREPPFPSASDEGKCPFRSQKSRRDQSDLRIAGIGERHVSFAVRHGKAMAKRSER
jgi:hypothetical protein